MSPDTAVALDTPILRIKGMTKIFPGTVALDDVDLEVRQGEVHALIGTNGSGKSTLIKVLAGYHSAEAGEAWVGGEPFQVTGRVDQSEALRFVHQDLGLVLQLNSLDNLALHGGYPKKSPNRIDWDKQRRMAFELLSTFDIGLNIDLPLSMATPVQRTVVAIAAALQGWNAERGMLVLDEPTAVLPPDEVGRLFEIIRGLKERGISVLYVSHRLDEIFECADRVTVLRGGKMIDTKNVADVDKKQLISLMLGKEMDAGYRVAHDPAKDAETVLEVRGLTGHFAKDISFELRRGEVLGLAGLAGSGREEVPYAIAGATAIEFGGEVRMPAAGIDWKPVGDVEGLKLSFVPADRGSEGVIDGLSVEENLTLSILHDFGSNWFLSKRKERRIADELSKTMTVKVADLADPITSLSGGNQQKVLIGRCLASQPQVLVMAEPTAGVDIGARRGIFDLLAEQSQEGLSVIVASTDVDDLLSICTRVLVFQDGAIISELTGDAINETTLVQAIEGIEASTGEAK